jgi:hypothetical protein
LSLVTVFRDKFAKSWPKHDEGELGYVRPLGLVLERDYTTDAHFVAYESPTGRRLSVEALEHGIEVSINCVVFDLDCPETHGTSEPAPLPWRRELREKMMRMRAVHPGGYFYETKGGARLVHTQQIATVLVSPDDAAQWTRDYLTAVAYMKRRFGLPADPACADWTRHFRCPRATRNRGGAPENWPYFGDANAIGELMIDATWGEVEDARKQHPRRFQERRQREAYTGTGDGILYHALKRRGDVVHEVQRNRQRGWIIKCPNREQHSTDTNGTNTTILYPPSRGPFGFICCLHAHCVDLTQQQWLEMFTKEEIAAAEKLCGIERAA